MATKSPSNAGNSKLAIAMAHLSKKKGLVDLENRVSTAMAATSLEHISTGCILVDHLIGGVQTTSGDLLCPGFPKGRIIEIYGGEGSGKTSLCLQAAVRNQKVGGSTMYLDYENAMSLPYARQLGLQVDDADTFSLWNPEHFEEGAELIEAGVRAGVELIIVDSVAAMVPKKLLENDISELGQIGILARSLSSFFPRIVKAIKQNGTTLVFINQVRSRIKSSMYDTGPDEDTSGGKAIKYYASLRLKLHPKTKLKTKVANPLTGEIEEQNHATIVRATCIKNKIAPLQGHTVDIVVRFGSGFDNVQSIMDICLKRNIISRAGAWYSWIGANNEPKKLQSAERVYEFLKMNPPELVALAQRIEDFFTPTEPQSSTLTIDDPDIIAEEVPEEVDADMDDNGEDISE